MGQDLEEFLRAKQIKMRPTGFEVEPGDLNPYLKEFQRDAVRVALKCGKFCVWAGTGLGKTLMQLSWAKAIHDRTQKPVLVLAPLGIARQSVREGEKFGIEVNYCRDKSGVVNGINITNYDVLHHFDLSVFSGVALDESSAIKHDNAARSDLIIEGFNETPYKTAWSATPAPNDYMELGQQAEFLGVCTKAEMLAMFFTHDGGDTSKWVLKGHAKKRFWEWVCSWAVYIRKPSDLGYTNEGYDLPPLNLIPHEVDTVIPAPEGQLFFSEAKSLAEQRYVAKESLVDRVKVAADLVNASPDRQWLIWCYRNDESDLLKKMIEGAIVVQGSDSREHKEGTLQGFQDGEIRRLITKPQIFGFGANLQNCSDMVFVGVNHSWEWFYQAVRRCYRFGQEKPVNVHLIYHPLEGAVTRNLQRKEDDAAQMAEEMVGQMKKMNMAMLGKVTRFETEYNPTVEMRLPEWLLTA